MLVSDEAQCSLFKKPYLTLNCDTLYSNLKSPLCTKEKILQDVPVPILWTVMMMIVLRFANDMSFKEGCRSILLSSLSRNSNPFLMKRHAQISSEVRQCLFQLGPTVQSSLIVFLVPKEHHNHTDGIFPEIVLRGETHHTLLFHSNPFSGFISTYFQVSHIVTASNEEILLQTQWQ